MHFASFFSVTLKLNCSLTYFIVANKHCVQTEYKIVFFWNLKPPTQCPSRWIMAFPLVGGSRREAWKVKSVPLSSILVLAVPSYPNTTSRSSYCLAKICPTTNRGQTHGGFVSKMEDSGRKIKNRDQTPWRRTQCDIWHRSEKPEAQIGNLIPCEGLLNLSGDTVRVALNLVGWD